MRTVKEIRDGIAAGELTAVAVLEGYLARIEEKDGEINAFLEVFADDARARAKEIDSKRENGDELGVLAGVPISIKDNMLYKGNIASVSSNMLAEHKSSYNATAVQRLLDADAIIVGRTNMDDSAMGSSTESSVFAKTANPWDLDRIPGGSSGGAAAAVAAGLVPVSLASDTGGSIRQPAAMCGVTGFKPTYGRVSRYGLIAMASSLDQIGPIAHTAEDVAIVLSVIEGQDSHDSTSFDVSDTALPALTKDRLDGLRIGVPKEYFIDGMQEGVECVIKESIAKLEELGAELIDTSLPLSSYALPAYYILMPAEISSNLGRYDGMRYGTRVDGNGLLEVYENTRGDLFGHEVKRRILLGTYVLSAGYKDAFYKKALAVRSALDEEMEEAFKSVDLIISPTAPSVAWKSGEKSDDPVSMYLEDVFTVTANMLGIPAISVPCGFSEEMPVGLQFMGRRKDDVKVLEAAHAFQQATEWHAMQPE